MNIYDVYVADIYALVETKSIDHSTSLYKGKHMRRSIVLQKMNASNETYYIDLLGRNKKIKSNLFDCNPGDEYIQFNKFYEPITNYIEDSKYNTNISKKN